MGIERRIIRLIKSLDRIMDTWDNLTLRRTIVSFFTTIILIQMVITTILLIFGREISETWLGIIIAELGAWGVISAYYFNVRSKMDGHNIRNNIEKEGEKNERE